VRRITVGGGPAPAALCRKVVGAFPGADALVVYGSTEAEPIAHTHMDDVIAHPGAGLLVGSPVQEAEVALVHLPEKLDRAVDAGWTKARAADVGEVVVRGCGVSRTYVGDPEAVARNKVRESDGQVWHRTGDVARRDADGRLWLLGRTGELVLHGDRELHPLAVESDLADVPGVRRAALVAHRGAPDGEIAVVAEMDAVAQVRAHLDAAGLVALPLRVVDTIPTDARHNSKVDRAALRRQLAA
jgi:acyl-CoA synthetase (AMP-forming)/AMP-acid ligase II